MTFKKIINERIIAKHIESCLTLPRNQVSNERYFGRDVSSDNQDYATDENENGWSFPSRSLIFFSSRFLEQAKIAIQDREKSYEKIRSTKIRSV